VKDMLKSTEKKGLNFPFGKNFQGTACLVNKPPKKTLRVLQFQEKKILQPGRAAFTRVNQTARKRRTLRSGNGKKPTKKEGPRRMLTSSEENGTVEGRGKQAQTVQLKK